LPLLARHRGVSLIAISSHLSKARRLPDKFIPMILTLQQDLSVMNFKEIVALFKLGKGTAKSHMRNLIEIAAADGNLGTEEQRLLEYAAQRNNISITQLKNIQANSSTVRFDVPGNREEKFFQLYDLVHMMSVDKNIHGEELRLCEIFAIRFGYRKEIVREMIEVIRQNIEKWVGPKETMQIVLKQFRIYE
jgi:uncharacterized tellurite resistance protein B-like protein